MKTTDKFAGRVKDEYLELVRAFPLRLIRGPREHQEAISVLSNLVGRKNVRLSASARQYAEALSLFIQDFDERLFPRLASKRTSLDKLKYVMAESGTTPADLADLLGTSQPLISQILAGKRNLTPAHMRKLGERFRIEPGYFL